MCSSWNRLLVFIDDVTTDRSTMNSEVSAGKVICVHLDVYNRSEIQQPMTNPHITLVMIVDIKLGLF